MTLEQKKARKAEIDARSYRKRREAILAGQAEYRRLNPEKVRERHKARVRKTPYWDSLSDESKKKRKEYSRQWKLRARALHPTKAIAHSLSICCCRAIKIGRASKRIERILGGPIEKVRAHLESLFQEGMSWSNHGVTGWHIDHVIPIAAFDLSQEENVLKCFNYTNTQPLWANHNMVKNAITPEGEHLSRRPLKQVPVDAERQAQHNT